MQTTLDLYTHIPPSPDLPRGGIAAYGSIWEHEDGKPQLEPVDIEGWLYDDDDLRKATPGSREKVWHFAMMVQAMIPTTDFEWHRWVWECATLWCNNDWWSCWGPSSSGKSCVFGVFALCDWAMFPMTTVTVLVSTTLEMLKDRAYKYVGDYYPKLPERFRMEHGVESAGLNYRVVSRQAQPVGLLVQNMETNNLTGAGIKCVGFRPGESFETIKSQLGRHMKRNRIIVDELQGTNEAVLKLWLNAGASGKFMFGGFGNPSGWSDPLGKASEPVGGETEKASLNDSLRERTYNPDTGLYKTKKFKTTRGECLFLDGFEAPSILEPRRYPYLIDPAHIKKSIETEGESSPWVDTYIRGIIPGGDALEVVLSPSEARDNRVAIHDVVWDSMPTDWISLDLGHSGTDAKSLRRFRTGYSEGSFMIYGVENHRLMVDTSVSNVTQQIATQTAAFAKSWGIPIERIGGDSTATQGSLLDAVETAMGAHGIQRVNFAGKASDKPVKDGFSTTCKERYANKASELAGLFREFCLAGQVRGVDAQTIQQAASRRWMPPDGATIQIDTEKAHGALSPAELDTWMIACMMAREQLGEYPKSRVKQALSPQHNRADRMDTRRRNGRAAALIGRM